MGRISDYLIEKAEGLHAALELPEERYEEVQDFVNEHYNFGDSIQDLVRMWKYWKEMNWFQQFIHDVCFYFKKKENDAS